MTDPRGNKLSYLSRYREVLPNESIVDFHKEAEKLARNERLNCFEAEPVVIAVDALRIVQFERRAVAGRTANELLERLNKRLTSETRTEMKTYRVLPQGKIKHRPETIANPLKRSLRQLEDKHGAGSGLPALRSSSIVRSTKADYIHHGIELGLHIDAGIGATILEGQTNLILADVAETHAEKQLAQPNDPDQPLVIPFIYGHFRSDTAVDDYIDALHAAVLPVFDIQVGRATTTLVNREV